MLPRSDALACLLAAVVVLKFKVFLMRRSRFLQGRTAQWPAPAAQNSTDEQQTGRVVPHTLLYLIWPLPAAGHEAITDNLASSQCTTASRQLCCQLLPNTREATDAVTSAERHHSAKHGRECNANLRGVLCPSSKLLGNYAADARSGAKGPPSPCVHTSDCIGR